MHEANTTWAVVVGIDHYDDPGLKPLKGAVADAVAAVRWLRRLGVPDEQILLHASPSDESRPLLDGLGLSAAGAREHEIWPSFSRLMKVTDGTRLFVFLSGHGLYEPTSQRLFLTQEATEGSYTNLGIEKYSRLLLSTRFRRTFLFLDGCQNYPYTESKRQSIEASLRSGVAVPTGRPENGLAACFAASQGQRAAEIEGRGVFLHRLLEALDPQNPLPEAVDLDFMTGRLSVDLREVIDHDVRPAVSLAAGALSPPVDQTPQLVPSGALGADVPAFVYTLPPVETGSLSIDIAPVDATSAVDSLELEVRWTQWKLRLPSPRGTPLSVPITAHLPVGKAAAIRCLTASGAPWNLVHPSFDIPVTGDHPVRFELAPSDREDGDPSLTVPDPEDGGGESSEVGTEHDSAPPGATEIGIKTLTFDGRPADVLTSEHYGRLGEILGTSLNLAQPVEVASGVTLHVQEDGPQLDVAAGAAEEGGRVAGVIQEALCELTPDDVVIATAASATVPVAPAHIEVRLPDGGAGRLAGPLAAIADLVVEVPGDDVPWVTAARITLSKLEADPIVEVPPGLTRLRIDLPWGSWRRTVEGHLLKPVVVDLPARIGVPPLRVRLGATGWPAGYAVVGLDGGVPEGRIRPGILTTEERPLTEHMQFPEGWILTPSEDLRADPHGGGWMAAVGSDPVTMFPLSPIRTLAIDPLGWGARVEPMTDVPLYEWDLLVSTGRIEDIDPDDLTDLISGASVDEVMGLAAAYALHARGEWDHLEAVLSELRPRHWLGLDVDLLTVSSTAHAGGELPPQLAAGLVDRAVRGEVPLLRWGIALALHSCTDETSTAAWREQLKRIDATLSPYSVWTTWTE